MKSMAQKWENVYIFISSTFNDMHAERDYLVKSVFPELAHWCEDHRLKLVDIDLRWGVSTSDTENNRVVEVCLENIDICRPFFLCFMGQRRGWIPQTCDLPTGYSKKLPELMQYMGSTSITELEVIHAIEHPFSRGDACENSLFFFRDSKYLSDIKNNPSLLSIYTNDDKKDTEAVERFKEHIEQMGMPIYRYGLEWDNSLATMELYNGDLSDEENEKRTKGRMTNFNVGGNALKDIIVDELKSKIKSAFPSHFEGDGVKNSLLDNELLGQERHFMTVAEGFIERPGMFSALDNYIEGNARTPLAVSAKQGVGKSTLMANWITRLREKGVDVYYRFCGVSTDSASEERLIRSLLEELKRNGALKTGPSKEQEEQYKNEPELLKKLEDRDPIPKETVKMLAEFERILGEVNESKPVMIILDGLDQLGIPLEQIYWIPRLLNGCVKLVISYKDDNSAKKFTQYLESSGIPVERLPGFDEPQVRIELINNYLSRYLKALDDDILTQLANMDGADNPLYLKIILSELRVYGSFFNLKRKVAEQPGLTPVHAFNMVLERLEQDAAYCPLPSHVAVPWIFGLLSCAREGLSEHELVELLMALSCEDGYSLTEQGAKETVRVYIRQQRGFLTTREGNIDFLYAGFKTACQRRYEGAYPRYHELLSRFYNKWVEALPLEEAGQSARRLTAQLPYHLYMCGAVEKLRKLQCDYAYLQKAVLSRGVEEIIADYAYVHDDVRDDGERIIRKAIEMSAYHLINNPIELGEQLYSRLLEINDEKVQSLLAQIQGSKNRFWLRPEFPCLTQPMAEIGRSYPISGMVAMSGDIIARLSWLWKTKYIELIDKETGRAFRTLWLKENENIIDMYFKNGDFYTVKAHEVQQRDIYSGAVLKRLPKEEKVLPPGFAKAVLGDKEKKRMLYPKDIYYYKKYMVFLLEEDRNKYIVLWDRKTYSELKRVKIRPGGMRFLVHNDYCVTTYEDYPVTFYSLPSLEIIGELSSVDPPDKVELFDDKLYAFYSGKRMQEIDITAFFKRIHCEDTMQYPKIPIHESAETWGFIKNVLYIYNKKLILYDDKAHSLIFMDIVTREEECIPLNEALRSSAIWRNTMFVGNALGAIAINLDNREIINIWDGKSEDSGLRFDGKIIYNTETVCNMSIHGDLLYFTSAFCPNNAKSGKTQNTVYCFDCAKWEHKWSSLLPLNIKEFDIQCAAEYESLFYVCDTKTVYKLVPEQWVRLGEKPVRDHRDTQYVIPTKYGILAGKVDTDIKHFNPSQHGAELYNGTLEKQLLKLPAGATLFSGAATLGEYIVMAYNGSNIGLFCRDTGRLYYSFHTEHPVAAIDVHEGKICALTTNKRILILTPENMAEHSRLTIAQEEHDESITLVAHVSGALEEAEALLNKADDYIEAGENGDTVISLLEEVEALCRGIDKNEKIYKAQFTILSAMSSLGWYYQTVNEFDKSTETFNEAINFCGRMCEKFDETELKKPKFKARLLWLHYTLAYSYKELNKFKEEEPYITKGLLHAQIFLGMLIEGADGSFAVGEQLLIDNADEGLLKQYAYLLFEAGELEKNSGNFKSAHSYYYRAGAIALCLFKRAGNYEFLRDWYHYSDQRASLHKKEKQYSDARFIYTKVTGELEKHIVSSPPRYIEIDYFLYCRHRIRMEMKENNLQQAKDSLNKLITLVREDAKMHTDIHGAKCRIQTCKLYFELYDDEADFETALEIRKWCAASYEQAFNLQPSEKHLTDAYLEYERIVNLCFGRDEKTAEAYKEKMLLSPIRFKMLDNDAKDELQRKKNEEANAQYLAKLQKEWAKKPTLIGYKLLMKQLDEAKSKEKRDIYEDQLLAQLYNDLGAKMDAYVVSPSDAITEELLNVLEDWEGFYTYAANIRKIARFEDKADYVGRYKHTFRLYTLIEHERYLAYSWVEKERILAMLIKAFRGVSRRSTQIGSYYQCVSLINEGRYAYDLEQYEANPNMKNALKAWQSCVRVGHTNKITEINEKQAREAEVRLAKQIYADEPGSENLCRLIVSLTADYLYGGDYSFESVMKSEKHQPPGAELLALVKGYLNMEPDFPLSKLAQPWLKKEKVCALEKGVAMVLKYYYEDNPSESMAPYIHLLAKLNDDFMRFGPVKMAQLLRDILNKKEFEMSEEDLKVLQGYRRKWYG